MSGKERNIAVYVDWRGCRAGSEPIRIYLKLSQEPENSVVSDKLSHICLQWGCEQGQWVLMASGGCCAVRSDSGYWALCSRV